MSNWAAGVAKLAGRRIQRERKARGLTGEAFADEMTARGAAMTRSVLANLENGRRPHLSVAELYVAARILGIPPVALLVPVGDEAPLVEVADGEVVGADEALAWICGDAGGGSLAAISSLRIHRGLVVAWSSAWDEMSKFAALDSSGEGVTFADPKAVDETRDDLQRAAKSLSRVRAAMRGRGESLPPLPPELDVLDAPGGAERVSGRIDALGGGRDG